jgi:hypothetical protein
MFAGTPGMTRKATTLQILDAALRIVTSTDVDLGSVGEETHGGLASLSARSRFDDDDNHRRRRNHHHHNGDMDQ